MDFIFSIPLPIIIFILVGIIFLVVPQRFWNTLSKFANKGSLVRSVIFPRAHESIDYFLKRKSIRRMLGAGLIIAGLLLLCYIK